MSLPNYLAQIKSSGIYRFVWDKSQVPPQQAETLRLVVGYSEKGPFNTPVYVESVQDFVSIFGNISKRLERKGVYFHRLAQQALASGPILALNLKPFNTEDVKYINFDPSEITKAFDNIGPSTAQVKEIFNTKRFWSIDADSMVENLGPRASKYVTISATDSKKNSCSILVKKHTPASYRGITVRSWYATQNLEIPGWANDEDFLDTQIDQYFAEVYVFRGEFTPELYTGDNAPLKNYFKGNGSLEPTIIDGLNQPVDPLEALAKDSNSNFVGSYQGILFPNFQDANGNYISLDTKFNADNAKHNLLMKLDEAVLEGEGYDLGNLVVEGTDDVRKFIYIPGYEYSTPDNIWNECKSLLTNDLREALTNRVDVEYHYIVDTFDTAATDCKKELFALAQAKDNAFAIVNFPKMSKMGSVTDPKVTSFGTNMPSEVEGASFGAYYTQLTFADGSAKTVVPSAALVSNLFMEKWSSRQPYYIVAGPNFGRLSYSGLIGPDYNFGRSDLDILEPMGINAIVYVPRLGTYINSNQTAKQIPVSGLSKIHIRELVIYLQNEIEYLLQSYQWELNTQTLRDTIRSKADAICETIKNNGGLYAFKNVCDETNNTAEVIDNEMIILDTEIEPARGAGKMVHQLTIHKTGGLTSSVK